nr:hypothetical protein [uncultured Brevundimonas sp.]
MAEPIDPTERTRRILQAAARGMTLPALNIPVFRPPAWLAINTALNLPKFAVEPEFVRTARVLSRSFDWIKPLTEPMRRLSEFMAVHGRRHKLLEEAGWLPHYTTPFERLDETDDAVEIGRMLEAHYVAEWPTVRSAFLEHLARYDIDAEARAVFRLALDLHEQGHYRAVSPLLFPEIERLARIRLHDGQLKGFTSQRRLRERAGRLSPGVTEPSGIHGLQLYQRLDDHLYKPVDTIEDVEAARLDPVPNRHAVLHGLIAYGTHQNSLNALIMMDFVFQIFSAIAEEANDAAA